MKIIIPVAGKGTRLRPHTHATPKALIRVAGKPIMSHIIDEFLDIDFDEAIFIIGHLGNQLKDYLRDNYDFKMKFIRQREFNGLGHAIYQARSQFPEDDSILVLLGDIIFQADLKEATAPGMNRLGVMEVADPTKFGIVEMNDQNMVTSMVEKPQDPPSNQAITGIYYFDSAYDLFNSIDHIIKNNIRTRNEFQLTDAMKHMMETGNQFQVFNVPQWYDCGAKSALLETNEIMLSRYSNSQSVPGSIIIPPVYIGEGAVIENSIVGPNVSVAYDSAIRNSIVKNSILGIGATIENTVLENSVIGDYAYLHQAYQEFNMGPDSEMIFTG